MSQRLEELSVDALLDEIVESTGCDCCGADPALVKACVKVLREKLKTPTHTASDFEVKK